MIIARAGDVKRTIWWSYRLHLDYNSDRVLRNGTSASDSGGDVGVY